MKVFSPIIVLTLVVFCLVSPSVGWGAEAQGDDCYPKATTISKKIACKSQISSKLKQIEVTKGQNGLTNDMSNKYGKLQEEFNALNTEIEAYNKENARQESICDKKLEEFNKLKADFPYSSQAAANKCLSMDENDEMNLTQTVLMTMVTQTVQGQKGCEILGAKTNYKDPKKDKQTEINKLDEEIRKTDADIIKKEKSYQEELDSINEERKKLKEDWESAQEDAEDAQAKALSNLRDNQLHLADNIRKLQTAAITARQNVQSIDIEIKAALNTAKAPNGKVVNLRNENAIHNHCVTVAKAARKETGATGLSKNAASGTQQVKTLRAAYDTCITELHELRQTVYQSFNNSAEQRIKQQQDIAQQLSEAEESYSKLTEDYNKMLEQLKTKLSKALQRYIEKDNDLANKYNLALQRKSQEMMQLTMNKTQDQQKLIGKYNSQGNLSTQEAEEVQSKYNEMMGIFKGATNDTGDTSKGAELICENFRGIVSPENAVNNIQKKSEEREDSGGQR